MIITFFKFLPDIHLTGTLNISSTRCMVHVKERSSF